MLASTPTTVAIGLPSRQPVTQPKLSGSRVQRTPARRRSSVVTQVSASTLEVVQTASHLASAATVAAFGFWWLQREMQLEQDQTHMQEACPACHGSGYEACTCTRWSDGDVGCRSCNRTGYMKCRSCGGGGTAVPIKVSIRKSDGPL